LPRRDLQQLSDAARVWIFPVSPALSAESATRLLSDVDRFLAEWAAHGTPVVSGRELIEGSFLVVAAEKNSETSGCSIDRLFGTMKTLERDLSVAILDPNRIFYRDAAGVIRAASRAEFRTLATSEAIDATTRVFDPLVETLGDLRGGLLEKPAGESWHARAFGVAETVSH
jgi:hypothetical protein